MKYITGLLLIIIALGSCTEGFEDLNENPNNPSTTDPEYIFTYVTKEGAGEFDIVSTYNYTYFQRWIMQTAAVYGNSTMPPYTLFDQYRIQNLWEFYYTDLLLNCSILESMTADDPDMVNQYNVTRIWKAFCFHKVTDLWGDVPYSEALKITDEFTVSSSQPGYDTQEYIYNDLIEILGDAVSKIDVSGSFFANDIIYDGDLENWIKFGNSLRLRLAVRSGNTEVVEEIISENNLIDSEDASANFQYINSQDWWNPYYELNIDSQNPTSPELTGTSTPKISELLKLQLEDTNDPRLPVYAQPIELDNVTYKGVPNLMNANLKENQALGMGVTSTSYIGTHFTQEAELIKPLLSYAELCFLRAEAAYRGWTAENAKEWYDKGVEASMSFYEIEEEDISTFLAGDGLYDNSLEQIITQKWVALFLDGWEAFAEYRRTGFPQLKKYDLELNGIAILSYDWVDVPRSYVPGRVPYPDDELDLNNENYLEAVENQGGDSYYQQVWWSELFGTIDY